MKKQIIATLPAIAFVVGMAVVPNTFAESYNSWSNLKSCLETDSETGVTCTLSQSITEITSSVTIGKNVTLDLAGNNMTLDDGFYFMVKGGNDLSIVNTGQTPSTIKRSAATNKFAAIFVKGNTAGDPTNLTIGQNVTIDSAYSAVNIAPNASGNEAAQNVSNVTINGNLINSYVDGEYLSPALNINGQILGGPKVMVTGNLTGINAGLYQAGGADVTINGGTVTGTQGSGIIIKSGTLNLQNATILAQGNEASPDVSGEGAEPTGVGIQIESNTPPYEGNVEITIGTGTSITSEKSYALQAYGTTEDGIEKVAIEGNDIQLTSATGKPVLNNQAERAGFKGVTNTPGDVIELGTTSYGIPAPAPSRPTNTTPTTDDEAETEESELEPSESEENPNTGDQIAAYLGIAAIALLGLGATSILALKSRH